MTLWIIEPHDPLIFRDSRPFAATPGARARSLSFPFPSTTTGAARHQAGLNKGEGVFNLVNGELTELKRLSIRGPLLVELVEQANGSIVPNWLLPAPNDALLLKDKQKGECIIKRLIPLELLTDAKTDFNTGLWLVGPQKVSKAKPHDKAPRYWKWNKFEQWLFEPEYDQNAELQDNVDDPTQIGISGPPFEHRVHVSIDASTYAGKEGALFDTSGIEFTYKEESGQPLSQVKRLGLVVDVNQDDKFQLQNTLGSLGGERRMVSWRKSETSLPKCPYELKQAIAKHKACRLFLLTPAYFDQGYTPTWLTEKRPGIKPVLKAVAVQRPQVVSGWDMDKRERKPTRRLAPAGTVLFLKFADDTPRQVIEEWIDQIWMHCISDDEQDRLDGFGLSILGDWSGKPVAMEPAKDDDK
jgi:CRISPR-associated protein Cmr3